MKTTSFQFAAIALVLLGLGGSSCSGPKLRSGFDPSKNVFTAKTLEILEKGDHFFLLSLNPEHINGWDKSIPRPPTTFHFYEILGKTEIKDAGERSELLKALYKGLAGSDGNSNACFSPRHGIRAMLGDQIVELVICFQCKFLEIHAVDEQPLLWVSGTPNSTFNRALERAGLPIAREQ